MKCYCFSYLRHLKMLHFILIQEKVNPNPILSPSDPKSLVCNDVKGLYLRSPNNMFNLEKAVSYSFNVDLSLDCMSTF